MASGYHKILAGEKPPAATINDFWSKQVTMKYGTAAARTADADLTAALREGMASYTDDNDRWWGYNGTAWVLLGWGSAAGRPGVILTDTAQAIATATPTDITWTDAEVNDPDGWISGGSATLTVPAGWGGQYMVSYVGGWSATPGALAGMTCLVNGAGGYDSGGGGAFATFGHLIAFVRTFAAGDTLKFQCYQSSGSSRNVNSRLEIARFGI